MKNFEKLVGKYIILSTYIILYTYLNNIYLYNTPIIMHDVKHDGWNIHYNSSRTVIWSQVSRLY